MSLSVPARLFHSLAFYCVLIITSFPILARLWFDFLTQGSGWRQGDWLINTGAGLVRRGLIGDALIWLSDLSAIPLLGFVITFQIGLLALCIGLILLIWLRHDARILVLFLIASPAFFLLQWAGEVQGIMRKEILGYLAMICLLVVSQINRGQTAVGVVALMFFAVGCFGNIVNALMVLPFCLGIYALQVQGRFSREISIAFISIAALVALGAIAFALLFKEVSELAGMCEPLVVRGLDPSFCNEALKWTVVGDVDHLEQIAVRTTLANVLQFLIVAVLALVPIGLAFRLFEETRTLMFYILLAFVPMIPLYFIATDWGRWISISYSFWAFLVLLAIAAGQLTLRRLPSVLGVYAMLCLSLLLSHDVSIGWDVGGTVASFVRTLGDFL